MWIVWYTHSIDVSKGVVQHIDIRSKADGNMKGDSGITGVLTAMENIGQIEQGYVHGKPMGIEREREREREDNDEITTDGYIHSSMFNLYVCK